LPTSVPHHEAMLGGKTQAHRGAGLQFGTGLTARSHASDSGVARLLWRPAAARKSRRRPKRSEFVQIGPAVARPALRAACCGHSRRPISMKDKFEESPMAELFVAKTSDMPDGDRR